LPSTDEDKRQKEKAIRDKKKGGSPGKPNADENPCLSREEASASSETSSQATPTPKGRGNAKKRNQVKLLHVRKKAPIKKANRGERPIH